MFYWLTRTRGEDALIDSLIKPPIQKYVGTDDALRQRTAARRAEADRLRADAGKVETKDHERRRFQIHLAGER